MVSRARDLISSLAKKATAYPQVIYFCYFFYLEERFKLNLQPLCYWVIHQKDESIIFTRVVYHITNSCSYLSNSFHPLLKKVREHIPKTSYKNFLQPHTPTDKRVLRMRICSIWTCQLSRWSTFSTFQLKKKKKKTLPFPNRISQDNAEVANCWQIFDVWNRDLS